MSGAVNRTVIDPALRALWHVVDRTLPQVESEALRAELLDVQSRLTSPLIVAVAGAVSAGKSTLVNALLRAPVAHVAAGERSRHATWYQRGTDQGRVDVHRHDGGIVTLRLMPDGSLPEPLGVPDEDVERIVVTLDEPALSRFSVVDTPGVDTSSGALEQRARQVLFGTSTPPAAQALLYVMPYVDSAGAEVLDEFRALSRVGGLSVASTVVVMTKVDTRTGAGADPWTGARARARAARAELVTLAAEVVPVAGLLAETGRGRRLTPEHLAMLRALVAADPDPEFLLDEVLDDEDGALPGWSAEARRGLVARLHRYGVETCLALLREDPATDLDALHHRLTERCGFTAVPRAADGATHDVSLQEVLDVFALRADRLKALDALNRLRRLQDEVVTGPDRLVIVRLLRTVDDDPAVTAGLRSLRATVALDAAGRGELPLSPQRFAELALLARHDEPAARLGLPADADHDALTARAAQLAAAWRVVANSIGGRTAGRRARDVLDLLEELAHDPTSGLTADEPEPARFDVEAVVRGAALEGADAERIDHLASGMSPCQRLGLPETATMPEMERAAADLVRLLRVRGVLMMPLRGRRALEQAVEEVEALHAAARRRTPPGTTA